MINKSKNPLNGKIRYLRTSGETYKNSSRIARRLRRYVSSSVKSNVIVNHIGFHGTKIKWLRDEFTLATTSPRDSTLQLERSILKPTPRYSNYFCDKSIAISRIKRVVGLVSTNAVARRMTFLFQNYSTFSQAFN